MTHITDFCRSRSGNVAIVFALSIVPLLLAVGAGVDMVRVNQAQTLLQAAADAAALGGGASSDTSEQKLQQVATKYLDANGADRDFAGVSVRKIKNVSGTGVFSVEVKGAMHTSFMMLAGISTVNVTAISEVKRGSNGPLELVLALDTTYSMIENDKIGTLKTAATNLVNSVMTNDNVKVGVVPFADYLKVGMKYAGKSWLNVPADIHDNYKSCDWSYPDKSGCSIQTTCYSDGVPYSCNQENCSYWGPVVESNCKIINYVYSFKGCVMSRPDAYHASISDPDTVHYDGTTWDCGAPIQELTKVKAEVTAAIDALSPNGNTYIPSGLIWGWNMLTPQEPLTEAAPAGAVNAKGGKKVLVLMTDGANTMAPRTGDYYYTDPYNANRGTSASDSSYADGMTATLCTKIKAEGIIVYTVLFDVSDPNIQSLLHDCASDPDKSYVADSAAELLTAFNDIGASLTKLRLTK